MLRSSPYGLRCPAQPSPDNNVQMPTAPPRPCAPTAEKQDMPYGLLPAGDPDKWHLNFLDSCCDSPRQDWTSGRSPLERQSFHVRVSPELV
jgi:hypothetical protein